MKGASNYNVLEEELGKKMHKAIAVIQFKLEGKLVRRHKEFQMEDRALLHRINPEKGTITLPDGKEYPLRDNNFSDYLTGNIHTNLQPEKKKLWTNCPLHSETVKNCKTTSVSYLTKAGFIQYITEIFCFMEAFL